MAGMSGVGQNASILAPDAFVRLAPHSGPCERCPPLAKWANSPIPANDIVKGVYADLIRKSR